MSYDSIVIEQQTTKYIRQTPLTIIQTACKQDWTTYEGRRQIVTQHMNFKQKVPIPTSIINKQIFFPTHSPHHLDNSWIAAHHMTRIMKAPTNNQSIIQFTNGQKLTLNISLHTLRQQTKRALACLYKITNKKNIDPNRIDRCEVSLP